MEELRSCLFCGRYIDKTYRYCPHCGYEFTAEEEASEPAEDQPAGNLGPSGTEGAEGRDGDRSAAPGTGAYYLLRLHDIQKLLADMEKELDTMLSHGERTAGRGPADRSSQGALTTFSRDP